MDRCRTRRNRRRMTEAKASGELTLKCIHMWPNRRDEIRTKCLFDKSELDCTHVGGRQKNPRLHGSGRGRDIHNLWYPMHWFRLKAEPTQAPHHFEKPRI